MDFNSPMWVYTDFAIRKMKQKPIGFIYVNKLPPYCEFRSVSLDGVREIKKQFEDVDRKFGNHIEYIIVSYQKVFYLLTKEDYEKISN